MSLVVAVEVVDRCELDELARLEAMWVEGWIADEAGGLVDARCVGL